MKLTSAQLRQVIKSVIKEVRSGVDYEQAYYESVEKVMKGIDELAADFADSQLRLAEETVSPDEIDDYYMEIQNVQQDLRNELVKTVQRYASELGFAQDQFE